MNAQSTKPRQFPGPVTLLKAFRLALSFLTRLPVGRLGDISATDWRWFAAGFPFCGYILAAAAFVIPGILLPGPSSKPLPNLLLAVLSVSILAYLTRGLHLDGVADMCDAYGGGHDKERRLAILKDPRVGSFGVVGLCLLLIAKTTALAVLFASGRVLACAAVVVASRFFLTFINTVGHYARKDGTAVHVVGKVPVGAFLLAGVCALPCLFVSGMPSVVCAMLAVALVMKWQADNALGGVTGDILGACCEFCETIGYVTIALGTMLSNPT